MGRKQGTWVVTRGQRGALMRKQEGKRPNTRECEQRQEFQIPEVELLGDMTTWHRGHRRAGVERELR